MSIECEISCVTSMCVVHESRTGINVSPSKLSKEIEAVEKQMYEHARNLEFEQAAVLRDRLEQMKQIALGPG